MRLKSLNILFCFLFSSVFLLPLQSHGEVSSKLKTFLTSCAYGTAAGALVGVASFAFASDPTSSVGNVARGASLGLYVGIGVGFYMITDGQEAQTKLPESTQIKQVTAPSPFAIVPKWNEGKLSGAEVNFFALQF